MLAKKAPELRTKSETRLIMIRIVIVSVVLFFNALSTSFLDAFLPDVMVNTGAAENMTKAGKAAAWVTAGFNFGRFLSASLWGVFIDKYGRKPGLLIILGVLNICTVAFGFAQSYSVILLIRFITGFFNGLSIVAKTISMEVCSDDLKSWSISVTNSIWALGSISGPIFGSMFYNQYGSLPTMGSAISVAVIGMLLMPICWYFIDETLPVKPLHAQVPQEQKTANITDQDNATLLQAPPAPTTSVFEIPNVSKLMVIFSFNTFFSAVFSGLIIFWASAQYEDGGLDFHHKQISNIFLYFIGPQIMMQILAYPYIQSRVGDYAMLKFGHLVHLPVFFMIPFAHSFGKGALLAQQMWIVLWLFIRNMASFMNFSALQRFSNDIVPANMRGKLNGIQVTFSSALSITGPFIGKWLLSWSMTNDLGFPFDFHFVFYVMIGITTFVLSIIYSLRFKDENKQKLVTLEMTEEKVYNKI